MCDCFDNYPTFYNAKIVKARKLHKCCECRQPIETGTHYHRADGLWDGEVSTFKTCLECKRLIDFILAKYPNECECLGHGDLRETLYEMDGVIPDDDDLYEDEPEDLKIFANCTIVSSAPWLKRVNGVWRLVESEVQEAALCK